MIVNRLRKNQTKKKSEKIEIKLKSETENRTERQFKNNNITSPKTRHIKKGFKPS